jgi:hypothetical protein
VRHAQTPQKPALRQPRHPRLKDKDGLPIFTLHPSELTPFGAKSADYLGAACGWAVAGWLIMVLWKAQNPLLTDWALALAAAYGLHFVAAWYFREIFKVQTVICMDTKTLSVRRWFWWRHYDRTLEHRFALLLHDKASAEQAKNDLATRQAGMRGAAILKPVYYGNSLHVVLAYEGHRIDLMEVFRPKPAAAIVARLQYCDRLLDEAAKMGNSAEPLDKEWTKSPGGLDDE